jgi:hypothetical protein
VRGTVSYEKVNTPAVDFFPVVSRSTGQLVPGLQQSDFEPPNGSIALYNPSGQEVSGSVSVTITALGGGEYKTSFTPNVTGEWLLVVTHDTHFPWGAKATYLVYDHLLGASEDAGQQRHFDVHDGAGDLVSGLVQGNFTVALYNPSGAEVSGSVSVTITELGSSGRYSVSFTANAAGKWLLIVTHATYFPTGKRIVCRYYEATITAPSAPTLSSVVDDETGTSATATIAANNESNHMYVYYRRSDQLTWTAHGSYRTGSGDLQVTGLGKYHYEFQAFERSYLTGEWSLPSSSVFQTVTDGTGGETASGAIALPGENLRTLLANSVTFQALVGAGDATEAATKIDYPAIDDSSYSRPRALIYQHDEWDHPAVSRGAAAYFAEGGTLYLALERDISSSYQADGQEENAYLEFVNQVGTILTELEALANTAGYLQVRRIRPAEGPERLAIERETGGEHFYRVVLQVDWGLS